METCSTGICFIICKNIISYNPCINRCTGIKCDSIICTGSYTSSVDLTPYGIAAGTDGLLRIEFSEAYKDFANGVAEGQWVSGSLGLGVTAAAVPEPASAALAALGLGLLGLQTRRARRG